MKICSRLFLILFFFCIIPLLAEDLPKNEPGNSVSSKHDPFKDNYVKYIPDFMKERHRQRYPVDPQKMKLSSESAFFTLTLLEESDRANALVEAALKREKEGQYREALQVYQQILDKYPDALYRVSTYGIFVPVTQYCQRRILQFPKDALEYYRTKFDARAEETYTQALRKNSLEGLGTIRDTMLATSYGGPAMMKLGDAALDRGHYLEALEYFNAVKNFFPDKKLKTSELALKIALCNKMLGSKDASKINVSAETALTGDTLQKFKTFVNKAKYTPPSSAQCSSKPYVSADDYMQFPGTNDPLGLQVPVWRHPLPGSRGDQHVYTHPVITDNSIIYRHKNILYACSLLTGELRWKNDLGGRVKWQNWHERQYPEEDILVKDGLVFTPMYKVGPTLVAIDEITGSLKWAYGPMVASNQEEANLRFESAPAAGPRAVYAGYVLDNIEGDTHIDSEYGMIAFESATGRIKWRKPLCRLRPGKFTAGFATQRKNRIRSFISPPLYHQGTVYYSTNAGAIVALDALSGRVKWVIRYPYYAHPHNVHDSTRQFGRLSVIHGGTTYVRPHYPMFWVNQRPLLVGEQLYIFPVDSPYMFCLDRCTGKIKWSRKKPGAGFTYFMGPISTGELLMVTNGRNGFISGGGNGGPPLILMDPRTGKTVWKAPDIIMKDNKPVMKHYIYYSPAYFQINSRWFESAARPFLTAKDMVYITNYTDASIYWRPGCFVYHLAGVDLKNRKLIHQRRYYTPTLLAHTEYMIYDACPKDLKANESLPHKDKKVKHRIKVMQEISKDTIPINRYGPFRPFSRTTLNKYGALFEFRFGPRAVSMVYNWNKVKKAVAGRNDPEGLFARAELAVGASRLLEASQLMKQCLSSLSSEDLDMRAAVNQQLFKVYKRLAQADIRSGLRDRELEHCMGMHRTVSTLSEEIEALFALSDAYSRTGRYMKAVTQLQSIISTYGHHEYPVPSFWSEQFDMLEKTAKGIFSKAFSHVQGTVYGAELGSTVKLTKKGLPLYMSTLSPLYKDLTVRAGDLAVSKLINLQKIDSTFRDQFHKDGKAKLTGNLSAEEKFHSLKKYPATPAAQGILNSLFDRTASELSGKDTLFSRKAELRKQLWSLADTARVAGLTIPDRYKNNVLAPSATKAPASLHPPYKEHEIDLSDKRGPAYMVLQRRDDCSLKPDLLFLGARVKKKFDNKFLLRCISMKNNKTVWDAKEQRGPQWFSEIRLKGKGNEPGFMEVFVSGNLVLVHGMYDVLAFNISDGKIVWRFRVPFDFEIFHAAMSGDMLMLAGHAESIALYIPTQDPTGEVVWQEAEEGILYITPFFYKDLYISLRKMPFNLSVRYRSTGKLIGRLDLPDLLLNRKHPILEKRLEKLPTAVYNQFIVVTDGFYYILLDAVNMKIVWKRLIDSNDMSRIPSIRFAMNKDYITVVKEDYDRKAIYVLEQGTGKVLWGTDPKTARPEPIYAIHIEGDTMYGLMPHPGQGFYLVARNCKNGTDLYKREYKGYQARPEAELWENLFQGHAVTRVKDRQDFEMAVFSRKSGKCEYRIKKKGVGSFGEPGRVSAAVQNGNIILLSKDKLFISK